MRNMRVDRSVHDRDSGDSDETTLEPPQVLPLIQFPMRFKATSTPIDQAITL